MSETKQIIIQEFFGKVFGVVDSFTESVFSYVIEDSDFLNSEATQENIYKAKQNLVNLTKENIVKSNNREDFTKVTKQSFNGFLLAIPNGQVSLLEICNIRKELLSQYLAIFDAAEENFLTIKDAILQAEEGLKQEEKAKSIKLETKKEPLTEEDLRKQTRTQKIMERVEKLLKKFGEAFAKVFKSEGAVLADFGVTYQGKIPNDQSGQLKPTVGIPNEKNRGRQQNYE